MSAVPESLSEENPEHLLVLDDEKSIRWVLERTLTQSGYHVHLATDASEAHHLLNQYCQLQTFGNQKLLNLQYT